MKGEEFLPVPFIVLYIKLKAWQKKQVGIGSSLTSFVTWHYFNSVISK